MSSLIGRSKLMTRNFDPSPPPARVTFDNHGQAVFLSELEHADVPAPAPTPMYAGVTANTPRVRVND